MGIDYIKSKLAFVHSEDLGALANAALIKLLLKLPVQTSDSTKIGFFGAWLCVEADVAGGTNQGFSVVEVVETPSTSVDGTARTPRCLNRLDTPPNSLVPLFLNSDATGGTLIHRGSAQGPLKYCSPPIIMKPNTNYLARLTNLSTAALIGGTLTVCIKQLPTFDYLYKKEQ